MLLRDISKTNPSANINHCELDPWFGSPQARRFVVSMHHQQCSKLIDRSCRVSNYRDPGQLGAPQSLDKCVNTHSALRQPLDPQTTIVLDLVAWNLDHIRAFVNTEAGASDDSSSSPDMLPISCMLHALVCFLALAQARARSLGTGFA